MAAAHATKEGLWLRKLLGDFRISVATLKMLADKQRAIKLIKNPIASVRSKHIDVIHHFVRERVARNEIEFNYVPTSGMIADVFTKALPLPKFSFCLKGMGVF